MVAQATIDGLSHFPQHTVLSITSDNGSEFAKHEKISDTLQADFYFSHPYSSWERGLNENTNGLVRQYLKKGSCFSDVTDEYLNKLASDLNHRPRKSLGFLTPKEAYDLMLM